MGYFMDLASVIASILRSSWGFLAPWCPHTLNMRDFLPIIRLCYIAQLIFKKENYPGFLDLIIWDLGIEVRDSADQRFKMREEFNAQQFFHGGLWRCGWGLGGVSHDKDLRAVPSKWTASREWGSQCHSCREMKSAYSQWTWKSFSSHRWEGLPATSNEIRSKESGHARIYSAETVS